MIEPIARFTDILEAVQFANSHTCGTDYIEARHSHTTYTFTVDAWPQMLERLLHTAPAYTNGHGVPCYRPGRITLKQRKVSLNLLPLDTPASPCAHTRVRVASRAPTISGYSPLSKPHPTPTPAETRTFAGQTVTVEPYFTEGDISDPAIRSWANRQVWTAQGNSFAGSVRRVRTTIHPKGTDATATELATIPFADALTESDYDTAQEWFNDLASDFDHTAERGQRAQVDPVEVEAAKLAAADFDAFLNSKGIKPGAMKTTKLTDGSNKYKVMLAQYIDHKGGMDGYRIQAAEVISARNASVSSDDFDLDAALEQAA